MRANRIACFVALSTFPAFAHGTTLRESRAPEAVYYADAYADYYQLPRELIHVIIEQESGWNERALSSKGAMGLMQLMPKTAALSLSWIPL